MSSRTILSCFVFCTLTQLVVANTWNVVADRDQLLTNADAAQIIVVSAILTLMSWRVAKRAME